MKGKVQLIRIYTEEECERYFKNENIVSLNELKRANLQNTLSK